MTDYRNLSDWDKNKVIKKINEEIEPKDHLNKYNGFRWTEPDYTINAVKNGVMCAVCWRYSHICLCSHGS